MNRKTARALLHLLLAAEAARGTSLLAQKTVVPEPGEAVIGAISTNSPIRHVGDGTLSVGEVSLDKNARTVTFPAVVNMSTNLIEYVCDAGDSKLHETLFKTDVFPMHIHLAALLISQPGQLPATLPLLEEAPVAGTPVEIYVLLEKKGKTEAVPLERWVLKTAASGKKQPMDSGHWIYTSSRQEGTNFMAQATGIVMALVEDRSALINIKDPDRANDELWFVNHEICPPSGTPVQIRIRIPPRAVESKAAEREDAQQPVK